MEPETSQLFQCYICYKQAVEPRLCPNCSKITCYQCLLAYIFQNENQKCPHCKSNVSLDQFANCHRFIDDIKNAINKKEITQNKNKVCKTHQIQLTYYCLNCKQSICSDCIVFSVQHKQHKVEKISTIYKEKKQSIIANFENFEQKIKYYQIKEQQFNIYKKQIKANYEAERKRIQEFFHKMLSKLQQQYQIVQNQIVQQIKKIQNEKKQIENFREFIRKQLNKQDQTFLIHKYEDIIEGIKNACSYQVQYQPRQICFSTINEVIPKFQTFTVVLDDFLSLQQEYIYSQIYTINNIQWRLKIYPKGLPQSDAINMYVSIFVQMKTKFPFQKNYVYQIELVNIQDHSRSILLEHQNLFSPQSRRWGYNKFIKIYDLCEGFLGQKGELTLNISIRNTCYPDLLDDINQSILELRSQLEPVQAFYSMINEKQKSQLSQKKVYKKSIVENQ